MPPSATPLQAPSYIYAPTEAADVIILQPVPPPSGCAGKLRFLCGRR